MSIVGIIIHILLIIVGFIILAMVLLLYLRNRTIIVKSPNKKRQRRPWFNVSWRISVEVLKSKIGDMMGESFSGLFDNLTNREKG